MKEEFNTWYEFIKNSEVINTLEDIYNHIDVIYETDVVFPERRNVFRAFKECSYNDVKVVILGQDPYPGVYKGIPSACGLCFATENGYINPSLRKIFECLTNDGITNRFNVPYVPEQLVDWAKQGCLMLNTALTVEEGKAGSHVKMWEDFTKSLLKSLSDEKEDLVYLLMGKNAHVYEKFINEGCIIKTPHPMADVYSGKNEFVNSKCFSNVNTELEKLNKTTINFSNRRNDDDE